MSWSEKLRRGLRRVDVRLALGLSVAYAPLVGAVLLLLYVFAAGEILEIVDVDAELRLDEIERQLDEPPGPTRTAELTRLSDLLAGAEMGFALRDAGGATLERGGLDLASRRQRHSGRSFLDGGLVSAREFLVYERPRRDGRRLVLAVGTGPFVRERSEILRGFWISLASGVAMVGLLSLAATRWALAPLRRATAATERIDLARLDQRLPVRDTGDDVDRQALAVNRVLGRLEAGFARLAAFGEDVAHELRTPLNRVVNAAEVALLDRQGNDRTAPALETIRASAEEMSRSVEGLLLLARSADEDLRKRAKPTRLAPLFDTLEDLYGPACEERGVRLEFGPSGGVVLAEPTLLLRAIANLLDNAVRHTPPRGVVRVEEERSGGWVCVRVSDSGPGLAEADRERVFERFVRLDGARGPGGAGLGLPIARTITRALGGDLVAAESALGGACLELRLPAA